MLRLVPLLLIPALLSASPRAADKSPPIAQLSFRSANGEAVAWKDIAGKRATVVVFLSFDCPMSAGYAKPLADLAKEFTAKGVAFVALCPADDAATIARRAAEIELGFPAYHDAKCAAADVMGATITPQVFVLDEKNEVRYRGLIDDRYTQRLVQNRKPSEPHLKRALDELLADKPVSVAKTEPIGCKIVREQAPKPVAGAPTYYKDVAAILQTHCQDCHRPGEIAPFSLMTYKQARQWGEDIKEFTHDRRMPPWKPRAGKEFVGDRRMKERDIATLAAWVDAGCPEGDPKDAPAARKFPDGWMLGEPDLILSPDDDFILGATGPDYFRVFVMPTGLTEDRHVVAVEVRPGNPRVVHHAVNFFDATGTARKGQVAHQAAEAKSRKPGDVDVGPGFSAGMGLGVALRPSDFFAGKPPVGPLGGWAPGLLPRELPAGTGMLLPKGSDFVMQVHYHRNGRVEKDRTRVGLYFAKKPVERPVLPLVVTGYFKSDARSTDPRRSGLGYIPAGDAHFVSRGSWYVLENVTLHAVIPHMHLLGKSVKITMTPPRSKPEVIIDIPHWDYNWQENYIFQTPLRVRAGTRFDIEAVFDNSSGNPNNPHTPPADVLFGEQTTDEMLFGIFTATKDNPKIGLPFAIAQGPIRLLR